MTVLAFDTYRAEILKNYPWDGFAEIDGNFSSANGGCFPRKMHNHQDFFGGWAFVSSQDPFFITGVETLRHCSLLDHDLRLVDCLPTFRLTRAFF